MEKKCSNGNCNEVKSLSEFSKNKGTKDGHTNECKSCIKNRNRSLEGKLKKIYLNMIGSCKRRTTNGNHNYVVEFSQEEFIQKGLDNQDYLELHKNWVQSNYDKILSPSFDRISDYKGYSWINFGGWITSKENQIKGARDTKNGVNVKQCKAVMSTDKSTGFSRHFHSGREAARQLDVHVSHINGCLRGRYKSAKGYTFEYSDMNKDLQNK